MTKKAGSATKYLYVIGMALVSIGFLMPVFGSGNFSLNGFDLVGKGDSLVKVAALLVFAGAVAGIVFHFIMNAPLYKLVCLVASIAGGLYCYFQTRGAGMGIGKALVGLASKNLGYGFWMIVAGWCIALVGFLLSKK